MKKQHLKRLHWKRNVIWYGILIFFFAGFISFVLGFYNALSIGIAVTQQPEPLSSVPTDESTERIVEVENMDSEGIQLMVLGDSLARGTGDPSGEGFADKVARGLEEKLEEPITVYNFAVEGMRSETLVTQMEDELIRQAIGNARYLMISIGGNDLRAVARLPLAQQSQAFVESLQVYLNNLNQVIEGAQSANEEVMILVIGLYNLDYNRLYDQETAYLMEWNYETQRLLGLHANAQLVPTYDLFQFKLDQYLSVDGLHPNATGYEAIAERVLENLTEQ